MAGTIFPSLHVIVHAIAHTVEMAYMIAKMAYVWAYRGKDGILCLKRIFGYGGALYLLCDPFGISCGRIQDYDGLDWPPKNINTKKYT